MGFFRGAQVLANYFRGFQLRFLKNIFNKKSFFDENTKRSMINIIKGTSKISIVVCLLHFLLANNALKGSENWQKEKTYLRNELNVSISLKKRKYYRGEPIIAQVEIENIKKSLDTVVLKLEKNKFFHFNFVANDINEKKVYPSTKHLNWKYNNNLSKDYTEIRLNYLESFKTTINLLDWIDIDRNQFYFLKGEFYLNYSSPDKTLTYPMNELAFEIIPQPRTDIYSSDNFINNDSFDKSQQNLIHQPPYKIVDIFFNAQINKDWNLYLQTIDVRSYLTNSYIDTTYYERYISSHRTEREIIIKDFENFLIDSIDYQINAFDFIQTTIYKDTAKVVAKVQSKTYTESYLRKLDPLTGQTKERWIQNIESELIQNKIYYFDLKLYYDTWKIIKKEVAIQKKEIDLPLQEIPNFHTEKKKIFGNILFYTSKDQPLAESFKIINKLNDYLKKHPEKKAILKGYTDIRGNDSFNKKLSYQRVNKVKMFLVEGGISPDRIIVYWFGKKKQLNANVDEEEMKLNRRVEIAITD